MYFKGLSIRPTCHECNYTNFNRVGDFTIGDFWGIEKVNPDFDDNKGISLVMLNTKKAQEIWNQIKDKFSYFKTNQKDAFQPQLGEPTPKAEKREAFMEDLPTCSFEELMEKYL